MLFTSPAFIFLFLPLAMLFYCLFGKKRKKLSIGIICAVYHVFLNMNSPEHLVWLPLLVVFAFFAAELCTQRESRVLSVILGIIPIVWLVAMRQLAYYEGSAIYPLGITMPSLCAAAYVFDSVGGDHRKGEVSKANGFFDLWLYLTFFPIMILGPFLSFERFVSLTDGDEMNLSLYKCASGMRLFATGFIKRIAVGAVFMEGYVKIFAYSWEAQNFAVMLFMLVLLYFGVFFTVSGYYDMSVGLCKMLGMEIDEVDANPFRVATVSEYSSSLFGNVREWSERYVVAPICESMGRSSGGLLRIATCCICTVLLIRTDITALALSIPLIVFSWISSLLKLEKAHKAGRTGIRMLFGAMTVLVVGMFWFFLTVGGTPTHFWDQISFENAEYQLDMILISFSLSKYFFVSLIGFAVILPRCRWTHRLYGKLGPRFKATWDWCGIIILLALFVFTIAFFLPSFEQYNYRLFDYIII